jgi:glutamate-1-semialdehyde 2,1-aminomutase
VERLATLLADEAKVYSDARPRSRALAATAAQHWHDGVPLHWMKDWGLPYPFFVEAADGVTVWDVDGHRYTDFCLGDTGSMFGHAPAPVVAAIAGQAARGLTAMLPSVRSADVATLLAERFGLPFWQATLTATDANRAVIRWARGLTGRRTILIFNGAYHGAVDDTHVRLAGGTPILRPGLIGQVYDLTEHTRVIEFNDLAALEAALAHHDVALLLAEPVMTNIGMVLPDPGTHAAMREMTRAAGTLLAIDETHTITSGPGGYTRAHGLDPDFFIVGKPIAGGLAAGVYGFTAALSDAMKALRARTPGYSGMGTTLSANSLVMAAMEACLTEVMTPAAYAHTHALADRLAAGLRQAIAQHGLPWCVSQVGARVEFMLAPTPPRTGGEAATIGDAEIETALRLALINRGLIVTPFHNMLLVAPPTTRDHVDQFVATFDHVLGLLEA